MAQRAIWRERPDDPKSSTGWLLREGGSRTLSLPVAFALMVALGAAFLGWSPWALLALPLILLHVKTPPTPSVAATPLATVPPPGPAFECDIAIARGGLVYGTDQGIVTFVDGWLHFAGRRTEFAIEEGLPLDYASMGERITLILDGETVEFRPRGGWDTAGKFDEEESPRFARAFRVWFHSPSARLGESILPPRGVHPSGIAQAWRKFLDCLAIYGAFFAVMIALSGGSLFMFLIIGPGIESIVRLRRLSRLSRAQRKALANEPKPAIGP
ncbi:hypothetical protein EON82_17610 [bacterium]|nr:MAG: hypothetical protein EON82_17610 [bacterium]